MLLECSLNLSLMPSMLNLHQFDSRHPSVMYKIHILPNPHPSTGSELFLSSSIIISFCLTLFSPHFSVFLSFSSLPSQALLLAFIYLPFILLLLLMAFISFILLLFLYFLRSWVDLPSPLLFYFSFCFSSHLDFFPSKICQ